MRGTCLLSLLWDSWRRGVCGEVPVSEAPWVVHIGLVMPPAPALV